MINFDQKQLPQKTVYWRDKSKANTIMNLSVQTNSTTEICSHSALLASTGSKKKLAAKYVARTSKRRLSPNVESA